MPFNEIGPSPGQSKKEYEAEKGRRQKEGEKMEWQMVFGFL